MSTIRLFVGALSALLILASCAARQMHVDVQAVELDATPAQLLVEATIRDGDTVVQAPKLILLRGREATAFVGDMKDDVVLSGYTIRVCCVGDDALISVEHHRDGALVRSWRDKIPIRAASQ